MHRDRDFQAPWVGKSKEDYYGTELKAVCRCEWCNEIIYEGEEIYDLCGEKVCNSCIDSCKKIAKVD